MPHASCLAAGTADASLFPLKIGGLFLILFASLLGALLPLYSRNNRLPTLYLLAQAFAGTYWSFPSTLSPGFFLISSFGFEQCRTPMTCIGTISEEAELLTCFFAAGIVLATGIIHVLPDAQTALSNPCLNLNTEFPWAYTLAGEPSLARYS